MNEQILNVTALLIGPIPFYDTKLCDGRKIGHCIEEMESRRTENGIFL